MTEGDPGSRVDAPVVYAPILLRAGARLIDGVILFVPFVLFGLAIAAFDLDPRAPWVTVALLGIAAAYEIVLTARTGQTVGKRLLRICVRRTDGTLPGWPPSAIRFVMPTAVAYVVDWVIPGGVGALGTVAVYLFAVFDPQKQGLHDKAARTIVVTIVDPSLR